MKNMGMMNPPRHPDESVTAVPHSLASTATTITETMALRAISGLIWASPKVRA